MIDAAPRLRNLLFDCGYRGSSTVDCGGIRLGCGVRLIVYLPGDLVLCQQRGIPRDISLRPHVIRLCLLKLRLGGIELPLCGGNTGLGRLYICL